MTTEDATVAPPDFDDIARAAERLKGVAARTPVLRSDVLDRATGARVFLKPECLQRTGTFKIRGAYNRIAKLSDAARARGVAAFSSGNHAQGVAEAARLFGVPATIVMPADAPAVKAAGVRRRGAAIRAYDRVTENREEIAAEIAERTGAAVVPAYDHRDVIAGQGTAGLELAEDVAAMGEALDVVICPAGGGGLIAGLALAFGAKSPATKIYAAEPVGFDDHRRSLLSGTRRENPSLTGSACDALLAPMPGALTFAVNQSRLAGGLAVTDAEALAAVAFGFRHLKLVIEPGGAVALAAALVGKRDLRGLRVGVVISGGNVDAALFARAIGA